MPRKKSGETKKAWADVAYKLIDCLYNLFKAEKSLAAILLGTFGIVIVFLIKYPGNKLPELVMSTGRMLSSERFYFFPMLFLIIILLIVMIYREAVNKKEIKRLCKERADLIHGLQDGSLKQIPHHTSSEIIATTLNFTPQPMGGE